MKWTLTPEVEAKIRAADADSGWADSDLDHGNIHDVSTLQRLFVHAIDALRAERNAAQFDTAYAITGVLASMELGSWGDEAMRAIKLAKNAARNFWTGNNPPSVLRTGVIRIVEERQRQVDKKGWTATHDDEHSDDTLAIAAACYAAPSRIYHKEERACGVSFTDPWPWHAQDDSRPYHGNVPAPEKATRKQRIRLLEKAGALIAAEIDRLLRAEEREGDTE